MCSAFSSCSRLHSQGSCWEQRTSNFNEFCAQLPGGEMSRLAALAAFEEARYEDTGQHQWDRQAFKNDAAVGATKFRQDHATTCTSGKTGEKSEGFWSSDLQWSRNDGVCTANYLLLHQPARSSFWRTNREGDI